MIFHLHKAVVARPADLTDLPFDRKRRRIPKGEGNAQRAELTVQKDAESGKKRGGGKESERGKKGGGKFTKKADRISPCMADPDQQERENKRRSAGAEDKNTDRKQSLLQKHQQKIKKENSGCREKRKRASVKKTHTEFTFFSVSD